MPRRIATNPNYQSLAAEFAVGDLVCPFGESRDMAGRVVAVWPAIGMVDVQFTIDQKRLPVEDVQRFDSNGVVSPPKVDSIPGGAGTVPVSGGPTIKELEAVAKQAASEPVEVYLPQNPLASRVAAAFNKQAIYWAGIDRKYKATNTESDSKQYACPKCGRLLVRTNYKREDGQSLKLLACKKCLFLVKPEHVTGHHSNIITASQPVAPVAPVHPRSLLRNRSGRNS